MKKLNLAIILLLPLMFIACNNNTSSDDGNETIIYIHEKTVLCDNGELREQQCLQTRNDPSGEWHIYYDDIIGFDYEEGYRYKLKISIVNIDEPRIDDSSEKAILIKILKKTLIEDGVKYEL